MNFVKKLVVAATTFSLIALSAVPVFASSPSAHCRARTECDPYTMHQRICDGTGECILGYEDCANRNADCWRIAQDATNDATNDVTNDTTNDTTKVTTKTTAYGICDGTGYQNGGHHGNRNNGGHHGNRR